eukprot:CAMPEP_0178978076 /NCGR_PEP_ID=MMETSP0789-20121207/24918_1 /TAXON_ID=3005 /ORGANISM="Rhizosolenia setigera, Strain CCMP 1694" /LENGTH=515 /DNA_ID=CAMNT_0020667695 /DNA_START=44 /DNA_END=1588 /DNA_ORIENTATION=-
MEKYRSGGSGGIDFEHKYEKAKKWVFSLRDENDLLKNQIDKIVHDARLKEMEYTKNLMSIQSELSLKEKEIDKLNKLMKSLKINLHSATAGFAELEIQKLEMKEKNEKAMKHLLKKMMDRDKQAKETEEKFRVQRKELKSVNAKLTKAQEKLSGMEEERTELEKSLLEKDQLIESLTLKAEGKDNEIQILKELSQEKEKTLKIVEQKSSDLSMQMEHMTTTGVDPEVLNEKKNMIEELNEKCVKLSNEIVEMENVRTRDKTQNEENLQMLKENTSFLHEENKRLREQLSIAESKEGYVHQSQVEEMKAAHEQTLKSLRTVQNAMESLSMVPYKAGAGTGADNNNNVYKNYSLDEPVIQSRGFKEDDYRGGSSSEDVREDIEPSHQIMKVKPSIITRNNSTNSDHSLALSPDNWFTTTASPVMTNNNNTNNTTKKPLFVNLEPLKSDELKMIFPTSSGISEFSFSPVSQSYMEEQSPISSVVSSSSNATPSSSIRYPQLQQQQQQQHNPFSPDTKS